MTVSLWAASNLDPAIGTEHFLPGASAIGVYTFHFDTASMVAGDYLEARLYQAVLTGCTPKVAYLDAWQGVQATDDQVKISVPISNDLAEASAVRFSLTLRLGGASPASQIPWKILRHS